jgi:hypothetical protein
MANNPLTWRQRSPFLALLTSTLILVGTVSLTLIWPAPVLPASAPLEAQAVSNGDTMTELCPTCHADQAANEWHQSHLAVGLGCPSCHLARPELMAWEGAQHPMMTADHGFDGATVPCARCHL